MAGRAKENLPGGSLKYLFVYFKIRIFKCSYRTRLGCYSLFWSLKEKSVKQLFNDENETEATRFRATENHDKEQQIMSRGHFEINHVMWFEGCNIHLPLNLLSVVCDIHAQVGGEGGKSLWLANF